MTVIVFLRREWMRVAVIAALLAIVVLFTLLFPALSKVSRQGREGAQAKARQCEVAPISARVYAYVERHGGISRQELHRFLRAAPTGCPVRKP